MPVNKHFLGAVCVAGTVGNVLTLIVLKHVGNKQNSTNWLLQALAVVDSLYLLARLLADQLRFFACRDVEWLPLVVSRLFAAVAPYFASGESLMHMVSVWMVVVVTVDRYLAVCLPSDVHLRTVRRAKLVVTCVAVASAICCIPLVVEWKSDNTIQCDDSRMLPVASPVPEEWSWWLVTYQIVCDCLIRTLIPFVVLVTLSSCVVVRLRRMNQQIVSKKRQTRHLQQKPKKAKNKRNWRESLALTMVAVVTLFIGCQLPQLILRVSILLLKLSSDRLNEEVMQASNVASGLLVVNATANFFVYCAVGNTFRRVLLELVGRRSTRKIVANPNHNQNRKPELELANVPKPAQADNNK